MQILYYVEIRIGALLGSCDLNEMLEISQDPRQLNLVSGLDQNQLPAVALGSSSTQQGSPRTKQTLFA